MASADDPLADIYNLDAMQQLTGPNPYSAFQNTALSFPGYVGTPTNAMGQQIQPQPGVTLNSTPAASQASATPAAMTNAGPFNSQLNQYLASGNQARVAATNAANGGDNAASAFANDWMNTTGAQPNNPFLPSSQPAQTAAPAAASSSPGLSPRDYALSMLANPGKVTTPGATIPQASPGGAGQPNVLASFLASHQAAQNPGAGGYSNQGFFSTLKGLQGGQ